MTNRAFLLIAASVAGCSTPAEGPNESSFEQVTLQEHDLIPEGVAADPAAGSVFIGSTHKRKIIQLSATGDESVFTSYPKDDLWSPLGMEVDETRKVLWVNTIHACDVLPLLDAETDDDWMTAIRAYDLNSGNLLEEYILDIDTAGFNDLTVTSNGTVYATESWHSKIYSVRPEQGLSEFADINEYGFANGITHEDSGQYLFIGTLSGIVRIGLADTSVLIITNISDSLDDKSIDGLAFHNNRLVGHQSSRICTYYLNSTLDTIVHAEILATGPEFDSSTTGEIIGDTYVFIVNSQIRSGIDFDAGQLKPPDSLEAVIIRRVAL